MGDSPRIRRLRSDYRSMQALRGASTIVDFDVRDPCSDAPDAYLVRFRGTGAWKPRGSGNDDVLLRDEHEVLIRLGANYPRTMPELSWKSPIFHPNISSSGFVCLGGYGTFWAPSLNLDELCIMLWDMVRYENFDVNSPYNREAALWARSQQKFRFPLDSRPLRDQLPTRDLQSDAASSAPPPLAQAVPDIQFLDDVIEAEVVQESNSDILIIE
ncbi:MAG: ubiquitin-conjugating enzyme E2 [Pirellulaceae bacterium]